MKVVMTVVMMGVMMVELKAEMKAVEMVSKRVELMDSKLVVH